ncbi:MAG: glycosyltransferase [Desulfovibrio sp.]|jgi:hypothetical protein|nr:glycosyltransferase [Desulfovibrio sp.]
MSFASTPHISVCLPVYNAQAFLSCAVESILGQSYPHFELLVVDDGSTDASAEILARYAAHDERVKVFSQQNSGLVVSLNRLLHEAKAPLIARMDADDVALPDRFAKQIEVMQARPELAALGGSLITIDQDGTPGARIRYPQGADLRRYARYASPVAHPAVMMRTDLVKRAGGYRQYYRHCEDYDLWLRLLDMAEMDNLDDVLLHYRTHGSNISVAHAFAQRMGTCVAQAVARYRQQTGEDLTPSLAEPSFEALAEIPLAHEEWVEFWIDMLPTLVHRPSVISTARAKELARLCDARTGATREERKDRLYRLLLALFHLYAARTSPQALVVLLRLFFLNPTRLCKSMCRKLL